MCVGAHDEEMKALRGLVRGFFLRQLETAIEPLSFFLSLQTASGCRDKFREPVAAGCGKVWITRDDFAHGSHGGFTVAWCSQRH